MGSARERKIRRSGEGANKHDRIAQEQQLRKKRRNRTIIIAVIAVLFSITVLTLNSNAFFRVAPAVNVSGTSYSITDYNFYYQSTYNRYYSSLYAQYGQFAEYLMPGEDELTAATMDSVREITMLYNEAKENGYTLPDEGREEIETTLSSVAQYASENGFPNLKSYLGQVYGKGMTEKAYRKNLDISTTASYYAQKVYDGFTYSDEEIAENYIAHKDEFDIITYRYLYINGAGTEANEEPGQEAIDKETAMAAAKDLAEQFVGAVATETEFANLAYKLTESEGYRFAAPGADIEEIYKEWLLDSARAEGDLTVFEDENGYYVVYFVDRSDNHYNLVNVRHILIAPEEVDELLFADDEEGLEAAKKAALNVAYDEAKKIYQEWKDGEATEESFGQLATEHSDDGAEAGLYEGVYRNQMVVEFNDWIFADDREEGDTAIVNTEYGYHIMYFVGYGDMYDEVISENGLKNEAMEEWRTSKLEAYSAKKALFFGMTI